MVFRPPLGGDPTSRAAQETTLDLGNHGICWVTVFKGPLLSLSLWEVGERQIKIQPLLYLMGRMTLHTF